MSKQISVAVSWFHCGLAGRIFGICPPHRDEDVPREMREAADEWEKYRSWQCPEGEALILDVDTAGCALQETAVIREIEKTFNLKYMKVDSVGFKVLD